MIFQHTHNLVMRENNPKTETRRIVKPGECSEPRWPHLPESDTNRIVRTASGRTKWYTGQTLAVQPGRGKKAIGRIKVLRLRREKLHDITLESVHAEMPDGDDDLIAVTPLDAFSALWEDVHGLYAWNDNPDVWVIRFERVE